MDDQNWEIAMRIRWETSRFAEVGYLGKIEVVSICRTSSRDTSWAVESRLPGVKRPADLPAGASVDAAKAVAEQAISDWFEYCAREGAEGDSER